MKGKKISPFFYIVFGFLSIILIGMILLKLPISVQEGQSISWIDALFTATSAVCVTGLTVFEVATTLSVFGKVVLAILMQIGGLGIVSVAIFFLIMIGGRIGIGNRILIKEALNQNSTQGMVRLIQKIFIIAFAIELIAMIVYFTIFIQEFAFWEALGHSAFHAISSFNNAGFDILGGNSLASYQNNFALLFTTTIFIIAGGLGFIVLFDLIEKRKYRKFSTHTKIVLTTSLVLILGGTLLLRLTSNITWLDAYFHSVSARTAGFSSLDLRNLGNASILVLLILMFIGASPVSTGGGIKTTTFYIMVKVLFSYAFDKPVITHHRKISQQIIFKAFALTIVSTLVIISIMFVVMSIEKNLTFMEVFFETMSAFGTVGLSLGITPTLQSSSKGVISLLMFFGRLGPLTIISIFNSNWKKASQSNVDYIEEKLIIG